MSNSVDIIRVLHVDDEPDFAEMVATFLEAESNRFAVEIATGASDGFDRLSENEFDCLVCDFDMPEYNGLELLRAIRADYPDLPFILFTRNGSEKVASDAISAGVTDYLQKESGSSQYEVLANRIENAIEQRRSMEAVTAAENQLRTLTSNTNDVLWEFSADWNELLFINEQYEAVWGRPTDELREHPRSFLEGTHPDDRELVREAMGAISAGESVDIEYRVNADEEFGRWVWVQGKPVFDDDGEITAVVGFARDVTERKERERELNRQRNHFNALYENFPEPTLTYEFLEGEPIVRAVNDAFVDVFGFDEEMAIGRSIDSLLVPANEETEARALNQRVKAGEQVDEEVHRLTADGTGVFWFRNITIPNAARTSGFAVYTDVTERKQQEERFQAFVEQSSDIVTVIDENGVVRYQSPSLERILGYRPHDLVGEGIFEYVHPDDRALVWKTFVHSIETSEIVTENVEYRFRHADGSWIWLESTGRNRTATALDGYVINSRNITDRKDHEQQLGTMIDNLPGFVYRHRDEPGWPLEFVKGSTAEIIGYAAPELETDVTFAEEIIHPDDQEYVRTEAETGIEVTGSYKLEYRIVSREGETKWVRDHGTVIEDPVTGEEKVDGFVTDITEQKAYQRDIERFATVVQASGDPIYTLDETGTLTTLNEALVELTGYEKSDLIGEHISKIISTVDCERGEQLIRELVSSSKERGTLEMDIITADGTRTQCENHVALLPFEDEFQGTVGVIRDISTRVEREQELQRERDRLDEFASIVSHDLRNPLNVAKGRLALAQEECESDHFTDVERALERMQTLIEDLLVFSRAGSEVASAMTVDFGLIVESCWKHVDTADATLVNDVDVTLYADGSRLKQLVENLIRNAIEHGGSDATVTVGTLATGFFVEDDGPGIPEEVREDVFETGYSTNVEGTGFGLSIVDQIVDAHEWTIHVTDGTAGGARFEITGIEFDT